MKRLLFSASLSLFAFSVSQAVDFKAGTLTLDNNAYEKTVCYDASSGVISHTGKGVSGGFGQKVTSSKTAEQRWEKSEDGVNFITVSLTDETLNNITKKTWIKRFVKITGTYVTTLGGPFGFTKSGYTNTVIITPRGKLDAGTIGSDQVVCYSSSPSLVSNLKLPSGGESQYNYTWEKSEGGMWAPITGATQTSYSPGPLNNSVSYRRVVTNTCGIVYSNIVTISVHEALKAPIVSAKQTICYNSTPVALSATKATGGGETFTYLWQESNNNSTWNDITLSLNNLNYSPSALTQTKYYRLKATSAAGCGILYSNPIEITVYPVLTNGSISSNQTIFYNTRPATLNSTILPSGGTGAYLYQWQYSTDNKTFFNLSSASGASYSPGNLTQTTYFRRQESCNGSCGVVYSNTVTINVYNDLNAGIIGNDQDICYGVTPVNIIGEQPTGSNGNYTFQWEQSTNGMSWSSIPNGKSQNYQPGSLYQTTFFRRVVTSPPDAIKKYSNEIVITVKNPIDAGVIGNAQTICYGFAPVTLVGSSPTGGMESYLYQWYSSENGVEWIPLALENNDIYSPPTLTKDKYFKRSVTSGICGSKESNSVKITILHDIAAGAVGNEQTICFNTKPLQLNGENPSGGTGTYQYKWQISLSPDNFEDISLANNNYYLPDQLTQTTFFRRAVTSGSCGTKYSAPIKITVLDDLNPGTISTDKSIVCYDSVPVIYKGTLPAGGTGNYQYKWKFSDNGATWNDAAFATEQNYQEKSKLTKNTYYKRLITSDHCGTKESNILSISVLDQLFPPVVGVAQSYCHGSNISFTPQNFNQSLTYVWNIDGGESVFDSFSVQGLSKSFSFSIYSTYDDLCKSKSNTYSVKLDSVIANFSCDVTQIEEGEAILFKNTSLNANSFEWYFDADGSSHSESPWFYFLNEGLKTITLIAKSQTGCKDTLIKMNYILVDQIATSLNDPTSGDYNVYPNPFTNTLNIEGPISNQSSFSISNALGKAVIEGKLTDPGTVLNTADLKEGIYFLTIRINKESKTIKILKRNQ